MGLYVFQVQGGAKPIRSRVLAEKYLLSDRLTVPLSVTYIPTHLERYLLLTFLKIVKISWEVFP
jgi:hypothetical protein